MQRRVINMKKYAEILKKSELFKGIDNADEIINTLNLNEKTYNKGSYVYSYGDSMSCLNMVAEGEVHIVKEDYWGNVSILTEIGVGGLFGETYACLKNIPMQVSVEAVKKSVILEITIESIVKSGLIENLLFVIASKNFMLTNKLEAMSQRTIRNKVMTYLSQQSVKYKSNEFDIPFNRQQLADYLSVDRSALSKELGLLRDESILSFNKNHFNLK